MKILTTTDTTSNIYQDALAIRRTVFIEGQGVPQALEIDDKERQCLHFVLYDNQGNAAATCRTLANDKTGVTLQRMAVLPHYQGLGLGRLLLEKVIRQLQQNGISHLTLHAQLTARGFYDQLGFYAVGDEFEEAGIRHITMEKNI